MTQEIHTKRLLIRTPRISDTAVCAMHLNNLEVSKWLGVVPFPYSESDALDFIQNHTGPFPNSAFVFYEDALIGGVGIGVELGYWLAPHVWGKGFATEASTATLDYYFANSTAQHVASGYHVGNQASKNVLEKLGFKPSGMRKSTPRSTGVEVDLCEMTLTRADWDAMS